ncbi:hypothetical protein BOTBODRAFT_384061 [Botryobasidium botryosum FD-172 SS1]|uniref:Uncharacterized protein n=1 Tax=Botryobasidium botryosum (strain FD-172 SS1) TaxID=930990 RepID=A0A067N794_BOTB1|nr:hypothetical protein BOTBODRAFT_384061 [Botryobasidium botryosum FD-172 SS1]
MLDRLANVTVRQRRSFKSSNVHFSDIIFLPGVAQPTKVQTSDTFLRSLKQGAHVGTAVYSRPIHQDTIRIWQLMLISPLGCFMACGKYTRSPPTPSPSAVAEDADVLDSLVDGLPGGTSLYLFRQIGTICTAYKIPQSSPLEASPHSVKGMVNIFVQVSTPDVHPDEAHR